MVEFSPREKIKAVREISKEESENSKTFFSLEELREREAIEQKVKETPKIENLEQEVGQEEKTELQQTSYEPFAQQGMYDLKPEPNLFEQQRIQEEKEEAERRKRALL